MSDLQRGIAAGRDSYYAGNAGTGQPQQLMAEAPAPTRDANYNKMKPINIQQMDYGFIVTVGCQTLAIENKTQLISKFIEYVNAPAETETKHLEGKLFV